MTVRLTLPKDLEKRLRAEVRAGRHASLEEAVLERISVGDDAKLLAILRDAKTKTFAEIMSPVRKAAGHVSEDEIVRLVDQARGGRKGNR
jgi:hypothetical protein